MQDIVYASGLRIFPGYKNLEHSFICGSYKNKIHTALLLFPSYNRVTANCLPLNVTLKLFLMNNYGRKGSSLSVYELKNYSSRDIRISRESFVKIGEQEIFEDQDGFIEIDLTSYCWKTKRVPKFLYLGTKDAAMEFWVPDSCYHYFSPRLEIEMPAVKSTKYSLNQELQHLSRKHKGQKIIVFLPTIDWNTPLFQRPQQMALAFNQLGYLVLYLTPNSKFDNYAPGFNQLKDNLYVCQLPPEILQQIESPILLISWAINSKYLLFFDDPYIIYDYIDELDIFHLYDKRMEDAHRYLLKKADLVSTTAQSLEHKAKEISQKVYLCPNGVDYSFFALSRKADPPEDLQSVNLKSPVIGYYGALANWFDYQLVKELALERPKFHFLLIGMDYDGSIRRSGILNIENIHFLGPKAYTDLPIYLAYFDVAIIPFVINKITLSTNPIKMYEYMAAGKPVVTTALPECSREPNILTASDSSQFLQLLDRALELKDDCQFIERLKDQARKNTWISRVQLLDEVISNDMKLNRRKVASIKRLWSRYF